MSWDIDAEIKALLPAIPSHRLEELEADIKANGLIAPLVVWDLHGEGPNVLVDGHHRWGICQKLGVVPTVVMMDFQDRQAAILWVRTHARARRNMTPREIDAADMEIHKLETALGILKRSQNLKNVAIPAKRLETAQNAVSTVKAVVDQPAERGERSRRQRAAVEKKAPAPVVEAVKEGTVSVSAAYNQIHDSKVHDAPPPEEVPPTDKAGNLLPNIPHLRAAFLPDNWQPVRDVLAAIVALGKLVDATKTCPVAARVSDGHRQQIEQELKAVRVKFTMHTPHGLCPYCHGKKCANCQQLGWMNKSIYEGMPADDRRKEGLK